MMTVGKKAPAFTLESSGGEKARLEDYAGRWLVLYFYPKDDTPGCTVEAKDFRDAQAELKKRGAAVLGVSKDSVERHCKFIQKYELNFALLSDPDGKMLETYGAWGEKKMYGKTKLGIIRSTLVIDPSGIVRKIFPKVRVKGHVAEVLATLDELQA